MSDPEQPKETRSQGATAKGGRNGRAAALEKALRENLRRRKAAQTEAPASESLHEKAKENPEEGA